MTRAPSFFICYRRADEPYAAGLVASILEDAIGADGVFLDTLYLSQRGFERDLLDAVRNCRTVLAVIGAAWDSPANLARLATPTDWVRRELLEASGSGTPIVPVLVGRDALPVVPGLGLRFDRRRLMIDPDRAERVEGDLCRLLGITAPIRRSRRARIERATLALLRHVLPRSQRSMDNDRTVARSAAWKLREGDWLRFVITGNLPGKPNGSAAVFLTRRGVWVAQLTGNLAAAPSAMWLPQTGLTVQRTDGRRLLRPVTDLHLRSGDHSVRVEGIFGEEADEFVELAGR